MRRSLNVISLAGLAFAVGLVLDAAIIVQENIVRLRQAGMPAAQAAREGPSQVVGALFASTMTSIAIFLPILFMQGLEGQLFADKELIRAEFSVPFLQFRFVIKQVKVGR